MNLYKILFAFLFVVSLSACSNKSFSFGYYHSYDVVNGEPLGPGISIYYSDSSGYISTGSTCNVGIEGFNWRIIEDTLIHNVHKAYYDSCDDSLKLIAPFKQYFIIKKMKKKQVHLKLVKEEFNEKTSLIDDSQMTVLVLAKSHKDALRTKGKLKKSYEVKTTGDGIDGYEAGGEAIPNESLE